MSLSFRDKAAIAAMHALLVAESGSGMDKTPPSATTIAKRAFQYAAALVKELPNETLTGTHKT